MVLFNGQSAASSAADEPQIANLFENYWGSCPSAAIACPDGLVLDGYVASVEVVSSYFGAGIFDGVALVDTQGSGGAPQSVRIRGRGTRERARTHADPVRG